MKQRITTALTAPILLLAVLVTGCFDVETTYVVNDDGSGSQTMRLAIPAEVATSFGEELPSIEEMEEEPELEEFREALGDKGEITFFSDAEEGIGFELTLSVDASDDFGAALAARNQEMMAAVPDDETGAMFQMTGAMPDVSRSGDTWTFELSGAAFDEETLSALAGGDDMAGMGQMLLQQTTITTRLQLPGEIVEHNADEQLDDGTLVWNQTGADEPRTLMARSELGGGGLSTMAMAALLIGGIAIALVVGGYLLFGRRPRA